MLALVSTPAFDPNGIAALDGAAARKSWETISNDENKPLLNRALGGELYAPGSVFKIITATAMLENGATPDTVIEAPTRWSPPGTTAEITNTSGACGDGSGKTDLRTAMKLSCNTPFAIAGMNFGAEKMIAAAEKFGFHQSLEIPLGVRPSVFPKTDDKAALAMDSFGQRDVRVSPLQMAMVAAAVANKGILMQPYLVDQVLTADLEVVQQTAPKEFSRPMSEQTAAALHSMMLDVTRYDKINKAVPGIEVAGKTGTAEIADGVTPHAWFIGFDSSENPKVAVAAFVENGGYGYRAAAPIVNSVINAVVNGGDS
ncbi:penicillin-binding transpeptidase domain-containing protein [Arcanobacterium hippocoleae]